MKKTKLLAVLLGSLTVCALAGTMAGCRNKDDDKTNNNEPAEPTVVKDITYKPGDVIVDEKDVEYTETDRYGNQIKYTEKKIDVKYLAGNASYITLTGSDTADMHITGYEGDLQEISLKDIESKVKVNNAPVSVSQIDSGAFKNCATLEKVNLSKTNSSLSFIIGDGAFYNCTSVTSVTFPDKVYVEYNKVGDEAFYNNIALEEVTLGEKFTEFGNGVFQNCITLSGVTLPEKLTTVPYSMFEGCEALTTITLPAGIKSIEGSAFKSTALTAVPFSSTKDLRYIGTSAFEDTDITTLVVPDTVTYIGSKAFYDCAKLSSVTVPFIGQDITAIDTFINRYGMPSQLENKNNVYVTDYREKITGRAVSVTVTKANGISDSAFAYANDVSTLSVSLVREGKYKVYGVDGETFVTKDVTVSDVMGDKAFYHCSKLATVTLPAMQNVAERAFEGDGALTTVNATGFEIIESNAFRDCKALASYNVPATVKEIGASAFRGCTALSTVTIPEAVKKIGDYAFRNSGLTSFDVKYNMNYGTSILADCTKLATLNIDKFDDYKTVTNSDGYSTTEYRTIGSLNNLFASSSDLDIDDYYSVSAYPLYLRNDGYGGYGYWIPKSLTKVTVDEICQIPSNFATGLSSLTEVSLGFVESVYIYSYDNSSYRYAQIADNAFKGCSNLETLTVTGGNYVQSIGNRAFENCEKLTDDVLDSFNKVQRIGDYAFSGCKAFRDVTIPASVLSSSNYNSGSGYYNYNGLGSNVFYDCYGIKTLTVERYSLYYSNSHYSLGSVSGMFGTSEYYNDYNENSNDYTENGVPKTLKTVILDDVISLGSNALKGMTSITDVELTFAEPSYTYTDYGYSIGSSAFENCTSLESVDITFTAPENGVYIYNYRINSSAFAGCISLEEITKNKVDAKVIFGSNVFTNCYKLDTMEIPVYISDSTYNGSSYGVFYGMSYTDDYYTAHSPVLDEITLMISTDFDTSDTYYLGNLYYSTSYAASSNDSVNNSALKVVNLIAEPVTGTDIDGNEIPATFQIPANMFYGCRNLTEVAFDENAVTAIGSSAFYNCNVARNPAHTNVYVYNNWVVSNTLGSTSSSTKYILPASIVGVANGAIGSSSYPKIYFLGDEEDWKEVTLPSSYSYPSVYYYSQRMPASYGEYWQYDEDSYSSDTAVKLWVYEQQEYTLDANGGEFYNGDATYEVTPSRAQNADGVYSYELKESDLPTSANNPTRDGYFFDGWYTEAACRNKVSFPYYSEAATTLYAKWSTYRITYDEGYVTEEDGVYTITPTSSSYDRYINIEVAVDSQISLEYSVFGNYYSDNLYIYTDGYFNSSNYVASSYNSSWVYDTYTLNAGETLKIRYHIYSYNSYAPSYAKIRNLVVTPIADEA